MSTNRLDKISWLGCIVCRLHFRVYTEPEIHHLRDGVGMGQRQDDEHAIGLCPNHHRNGGVGVAFHADQKLWEEIYGTEEYLLRETNKAIEKYINS